MSEKVYAVPAEWEQKAFISDAKYKDLYARSIKDPSAFWADQAKRIDWIKPFSKVKNTSYTGDVSIKWFEDGTLNAAYNCIDRHLPSRANQTAIIWEGDDPKDDKKITYKELHDEVCRFANVLKEAGVRKAALPAVPLLTLSVLAGAFIALGAAAFTAVLAGTAPGFGPARQASLQISAAPAGKPAAA